MTGIYCFTNKINNKRYVGLSRQLEERYHQHYRNYTNPNASQYNTKFYRALRKYGFEKFNYEILTIVKDSISTTDLEQLEIYYIAYFDSYNNGYNMNIGGNYTSSNKVLNEQQVYEIKDLIINSTLSFCEIGQMYNVNDTLISQINKGKIWTRVFSDKYPLRDDTYFQNKGETNPNAKLSNEQVMQLREEFVNKTLDEVYQLYPSLCSKSEMKKILYGVQFQHLPIYKKRQQKWFLNGTCIDYPRLEE